MQLDELTPQERSDLLQKQLANAYEAFNPDEPNFTALADALRRILRLIEESE